MTKSKYFCLDIGTTSLKVALVSDEGQVLLFKQVVYLISEDCYNISEQWEMALKIAILEICQETNCDVLDVDAICISGNGPTIVSEDGTFLLWNKELEFTSPKDFAPSLFLPRLNEFKNLFLEQFTNQKIFSCPEFLIYKLCGAHITILPEERYKKSYWSEDDIVALGAKKEQFGKFVAPGTVVGHITKMLSEEFQLKVNTPVVAGGPDFIVALIGTNTLSPGKICDCAGSSEGINLCIDKFVECKGLRTLPSVVPGLWNLATLLPSSGRQFVECKKSYENTLGMPLSFEEYILYCANYKDSKGYKTMKTLAYDIDKGIKNLLCCAKASGFTVCDSMTVTGGQAKNDWWMQLKSDITNYKFEIPQIEDSELIGDAILCAVALGRYNSIFEAADKMVKINKIYKPKK